MSAIDKVFENIRLFDFYGNLLTDRQQNIFKLYFHDDLSLGEISENLKISRQAVYDTIKRTEDILKNYEDKLALFTKYQKDVEHISNIKTILASRDFTTLEKQNLICSLLDKYLEDR